MLKLFSFLFGLAVAVATVVVLIGYLSTAGTSLGDYIEDHYDVILGATGLVILGLAMAVAGLVALYDSFNPFSLITGLAIIAAGVTLLVIGGGIIVRLAHAAPS